MTFPSVCYLPIAFGPHRAAGHFPSLRLQYQIRFDVDQFSEKLAQSEVLVRNLARRMRQPAFSPIFAVSAAKFNFRMSFSKLKTYFCLTTSQSVSQVFLHFGVRFGARVLAR